MNSGVATPYHYVSRREWLALMRAARAERRVVAGHVVATARAIANASAKVDLTPEIVRLVSQMVDLHEKEATLAWLRSGEKVNVGRKLRAELLRQSAPIGNSLGPALSPHGA